MPSHQRPRGQIQEILAGVLSDLSHWSKKKGGALFGKRSLSLWLSLSGVAGTGKDSWI